MRVEFIFDNGDDKEITVTDVQFVSQLSGSLVDIIDKDGSLKETINIGKCKKFVISEEEPNNILIFSQRKRLGDLYADWRTRCSALDCPLNVISYLHMHGIINCKAAKEFLEKTKSIQTINGLEESENK